MKSGLLMSMPSAIQATFTPAPVASDWACGAAGSLNALLVVCSASGSSSGLLGSDGQVGVATPEACAAPAAAGADASGLIGALVIGRSGKTAATAGSAASAEICAV